jgi:hypothetical protein
MGIAARDGKEMRAAPTRHPGLTAGLSLDLMRYAA